MKAYEEQIKSLETMKLKFANFVYTHLRNAIGHSTNKHLESYKIVDNSINVLPSHKQIHDDLIMFKELMPWLHKSNCYFTDQDMNRRTYYDDIKQVYIDTVKQLYAREILLFSACAKSKIVTSKNDKPKASKIILD
jgi:hypothetical protein